MSPWRLPANAMCAWWSIELTETQELIPAIIEGGGDPASIVHEKSLAQISGAEEISGMVDSVVRDNASQLEQYLGGKTKLKGFFQGQLMKVSGGRINPKLAAEALDARLAKEQSDHIARQQQ